MIKTQGVGSMYKGLSAGLLRQATYTTARLGIYNNIFEYAKELNDNKVCLPLLLNGGGGAGAADCGACLLRRAVQTCTLWCLPCKQAAGAVVCGRSTAGQRRGSKAITFKRWPHASVHTTSLLMFSPSDPPSPHLVPAAAAPVAEGGVRPDRRWPGRPGRLPRRSVAHPHAGKPERCLASLPCRSKL